MKKLNRLEINQFARTIYAVNPIVHSNVEFYIKSVMQGFKLEVPNNDKINKFVEQQTDRIRLEELVIQILEEYLILGEVYVWAELDETSAQWSRLIIQNPDYVIVETNVDGSESFSLRPDEKLRQAILEKHEIIKKLDRNVVQTVEAGENIKLDPFYLSVFRRKLNAYEMRGCCPLLPLQQHFVTLDALREKQMFAEAAILEREAKIYLGYPFVSVENEVLYQRMIQKKVSDLREMIQSWLQNKIFAPVFKLNELYQYKNGEKVLLEVKVKFD